MAGLFPWRQTPFYREFSDTVPLIAQAQVLPTLQSVGRLSDRRCQPFARPGQRSYQLYCRWRQARQRRLIDVLISQWAAYIIFQTRSEKAAARNDLKLL
jgi:hypothetical protein